GVFQQAQTPAMRFRSAVTAQPVEPVVGMPAQVFPGQCERIQPQDVEVCRSWIPMRDVMGIDHDATSREQDSPPRQGYALHRHRQNVMGQKVDGGCQDRLAPMRCGIRLNAAAAAPQCGVPYKPACRSPRRASSLFGSDWCGYAARISIETYPV